MVIGGVGPSLVPVIAGEFTSTLAILGSDGYSARSVSFRASHFRRICLPCLFVCFGQCRLFPPCFRSWVRISGDESRASSAFPFGKASQSHLHKRGKISETFGTRTTDAHQTRQTRQPPPTNHHQTTKNHITAPSLPSFLLSQSPNCEPASGFDRLAGCEPRSGELVKVGARQLAIQATQTPTDTQTHTHHPDTQNTRHSQSKPRTRRRLHQVIPATPGQGPVGQREATGSPLRGLRGVYSLLAAVAAPVTAATAMAFFNCIVGVYGETAKMPLLNLSHNTRVPAHSREQTISR